jgi:hypothetical protein
MDAGRATIVLARYRALQCVRAHYRDAGQKAHAIKMHEQRVDAEAYLTAHPELLVHAAEDVGTKLNTAAPRKRR